MKAMRITNTMDLIAIHDDEKVQGLIRDFPERKNYIKHRDPNGDPPPNASQEPTPLFEVKASVDGLQVIQARIKPVLNNIGDRLAKAKRLRLIASIISALTGAGLL